MYLLTQCPDSVFDVRNMRAGNRYSAYYTQDSVPQLVYLVYQHSVTDFVVFHFEDSLHVEQFTKPTSIKTRTGEFVVETSLWNAIVDADMNMELALQLSDVSISSDCKRAMVSRSITMRNLLILSLLV